jgi:hypothetical protein
MSWKNLSLWWHVCQGLIKYHLFWLDCFWIGLWVGSQYKCKICKWYEKIHHSLTKSFFSWYLLLQLFQLWTYTKTSKEDVNKLMHKLTLKISQIFSHKWTRMECFKLHSWVIQPSKYIVVHRWFQVIKYCINWCATI